MLLFFDEVKVNGEDKASARFQYRTRQEFFFITADGKKLSFSADELGKKINYLKKDLEVKILFFGEKPIAVELPVKVVLEVKQAPPADRGNTAQGGTKDVELETGGKVKTPLFVKSGDKIEVNTETGEYVRRANE